MWMWWVVLVLSGFLLEARYHGIGVMRNDPVVLQPREELAEQEGLLLRLGEWYRVSVKVNGDYGTIRSIDRAPYGVP